MMLWENVNAFSWEEVKGFGKIYSTANRDGELSDRSYQNFFGYEYSQNVPQNLLPLYRLVRSWLALISVLARLIILPNLTE